MKRDLLYMDEMPTFVRKQPPPAVLNGKKLHRISELVREILEVMRPPRHKCSFCTVAVIAI